MKNILIVCTANKIRRVLAMEIANSIALKKQKQYFFQSAGIAVIGNDIDANVKNILLENGLKTEHVPTHINSLNIDAFDEIHVMTDRQKITICSYYKENENLEGKIKVIGVEDPFGKGTDAYRECYDRLSAFYKGFIV